MDTVAAAQAELKAVLEKYADESHPDWQDEITGQGFLDCEDEAKCQLVVDYLKDAIIEDHAQHCSYRITGCAGDDASDDVCPFEASYDEDARDITESYAEDRLEEVLLPSTAQRAIDAAEEALKRATKEASDAHDVQRQKDDKYFGVNGEKFARANGQNFFHNNVPFVIGTEVEVFQPWSTMPKPE